jgi:hypothetical protein
MEELTLKLQRMDVDKLQL